MKILYYNLQLGSYDGSNSHAEGLLSALQRVCGEENIFVTTNKRVDKYNHLTQTIKKKFYHVIKPIKILRRFILTKKNSKKILIELRNANFKPDFILARSVLYDMTPIILSKTLNCKLIIEHNTPYFYEVCELKKTDSKKSVETYESKILDKADGIYIVSEILKEMIKEKYPNLKSQSFKVVPNGFNNNLYNLSKVDKNNLRKKTRSEYGISKEWIITFIGSLQDWHGIDTLITIAKKFERFDNIRFWVAGDGENRNLVEDYTKEHANLKWFGNVSHKELRNILYASDLGIMPYKDIEHFYFSPLKMYDMVGSELPFIGLEIGQIKDFCVKELNQEFLLSNSKAEAIEAKIKKIISDYKIYDEMKELTRQAYINNTWDSRAEDLVEWMKNI